MKKKFKNKLILMLGILMILLIEPISSLISNLTVNDENLIKIEYLAKENKVLKDKLEGIWELNDLQSKDNELILAKVITRDIYNFYDELIIDKGSNDGINEGDSVISSTGFLGVVKEVRKSESIITLISNKDLNISVKVNGVYGSYNKGIVKNITSHQAIKEGDLVYTSGLTNIKEGLYIGKVKKVKMDKQEIEQTLEIEIASKVATINYVGVIK